MNVNNKNLLTIAGILNLLEGAAICVYEPLAICGLIVMAIGVYFLAMSNKTIEDQQDERILLLIVGIINIAVNLISSLLVFASFSNIQEYRKSDNSINGPPEEEVEVNQEVKNIDLMLKLGVAMVFISGVLFATTTWDFISDLVKALVLIIFGCLFVGLSYLTGEKLKLEKSSYVYWVLGMSFFLLTIVGAEFFGLFGDFLTFTGAGKYLAYFIVAAALGGLSHLTYHKYKKQYLVYVTYVSYLVATHNVMMQVKPSIIFSLIILSVMNILTCLIDKKGKVLTEISNVFIYILSLLVCANILYEEMVILKLLAMFISVINMLYLRLDQKDDALDIMGILITYVLVSSTISSLSIKLTTELLIMFLLLTVFSAFNNLEHNSILVTEVNNIIYTIFSIVVYSIFLEEEVLLALLVALVYLIKTASSKFSKDVINQSKVFDITLPISIPLFIFPFGDLLGLSTEINIAYGLGISSAIYCVGNYILKDEKEKKSFIIYAIISTVLCLYVSLASEELLVSIYPILSSLYLTAYFYNHKIKTYVIWPYILYMLSLYFPLIILNVFNINIIFNTVIFIWALIMTMILLESELIKKITEIAIAVPLFNLINGQDISLIFENIATSVLIIYITFVIVKYFIKENKCVWAMIGLTISLLGIIFRTNIYYALYVGLLGVLVMIFGYNSKKYSHLFKFGIGIIIVNIIVQLRTLWEKVPFYLYLLVAGLGIIGFVTYKELKKLNKDKENEEDQ